MQSRITKLKKCPECQQACDGKSCRCGWTKPNVTRINKQIRTCRMCNQLGTHSGFCEMHYELQAENAYKRRMQEYLKVHPDWKTGVELLCMSHNQITEMVKNRKQKENENDDIPF